MTETLASPVTSASVRRRLAVAVGGVRRSADYPGHRVASLAARALRRFPPAEEVEYTDVDGYIRRADLRDHMESLVFVGRHRLPRRVMAAVLPGDWVIDIGANVGSVAGQLSRAVGRTGLVWAFEPLPRNVARLHQLAEANALAQLEVFPCALSSTKGTSAIRLAGEGFSGHASFTASWIRGGRLDVATERLDDIVGRSEAARSLRLVKIDVEGFESQVIEGAQDTLRRFRPFVYCEFNDIILRDAGSSAASLLQAFVDLGYTVARQWQRRSRRLDGRNVDLFLAP